MPQYTKEQEEMIARIRHNQAVKVKIGDSLIEGLLPHEDMNSYDRTITPILNRYMNAFARQHIPFARKIYATLVAKGHDSYDNAFEHNDMDNHAWYIPHESLEVVCLSSQNTRYMYVLRKATIGADELIDILEEAKGNAEVLNSLHDSAMQVLNDTRSMRVFKFYDTFRGQETYTRLEYVTKDEIDLDSDNISGNQYVSKPDTKWFIDNDFNEDDKHCFVHPFIDVYPAGSRSPIGHAPNPIYHYADVNMCLWDLKVTSDLDYFTA